MSNTDRLGSLPFTPRDEEVSGVCYIGDTPYIGTAKVIYPWCDVCHDLKPSMRHLYSTNVICMCGDDAQEQAGAATAPSFEELLERSLKQNAKLFQALADADARHEGSRYQKLHLAVDELMDYSIASGIKDAELRRRLLAVLHALPDQVAQ